MAAIPVYIVGTITTKEGIEQCVLEGLASLQGLEVGGGPILPPAQPPSIWPGGKPEHPIVLPPEQPPGAPGAPGIWPGGKPEHPIVLPPVEPGGPPVTIWPGRPEHPIVLPPAPPIDTTIPGGGKPPPPEGGWGFHPVFGWGYFPGPGQPGPK